jgi:hypothetical protein
VDPSSYDYRRAAWDAAQFPALIDRFFQNLRRAVGWNVQYFGTVEPQRRLTPHAHFAIRGAIPRATIRQVVEATYRQVWWPPTTTVCYPEHAPAPVWNPDRACYVDPGSGQALRSWQDALDDLDDELDDDAERGPEHVVRFGEQMKLQGVLGGTAQADKLIRYLCKYLTKSVADCHHPDTDTAEEHHRRLWEELRYTPCSPRCANWLRYGINPAGARDGLRAGMCRAKVHQVATLGLGGRRVLVSRDWSGKTLSDFRHDQKLWLTRMLGVTRRHTDDVDDQLAEQIQLARERLAPDPIFWDLAKPGDPDVPDLATRLLNSIATAIKRREWLDAARSGDPPDPDSATSGGGADE